MVLYTTQHYELTATQEKILLQSVIYSKSVPVNGTKDYDGVKIHLHSFLAEQDRREGMNMGEEKNLSKRDSSILHSIT